MLQTSRTGPTKRPVLVFFSLGRTTQLYYLHHPNNFVEFATPPAFVVGARARARESGNDHHLDRLTGLCSHCVPWVGGCVCVCVCPCMCMSLLRVSSLGFASEGIHHYRLACSIAWKTQGVCFTIWTARHCLATSKKTRQLSYMDLEPFFYLSRIFFKPGSARLS